MDPLELKNDQIEMLEKLIIQTSIPRDRNMLAVIKNEISRDDLVQYGMEILFFDYIKNCYTCSATPEQCDKLSREHPRTLVRIVDARYGVDREPERKRILDEYQRRLTALKTEKE